MEVVRIPGSGYTCLAFLYLGPCLALTIWSQIVARLFLDYSCHPEYNLVRLLLYNYDISYP
jgi:hypothetical protein